MIPGWKLKRELERLKVQAQAVPLALYEPFVQRRHDRERGTRIAVTPGALAAGEKLAIFLLFQPKGVAASVLLTCRHLADSGFAPIVVSNTPLSKADRAALAGTVHLVAERPNLGYDFGGYRDGLWLIGTRGLSPRQVLFLNDSVWFPVWPGSTLLSEMAGADADYVGTQVFGDVSPGAAKPGFFGSYCFLAKAPLLETEAFRGFWEGYRLSSNKEVTLRRGERAFSHRMLGAARRSLGIYSIGRFHGVVDALGPDGLREALGDMVALDPVLEGRRAALLAESGAGWEDRARTLLRDSAQSKNYIGAAPVLSLRDLRFPMIKKNNEMLYRRARARIVAALDEGRLSGIDPVIESELRARVAAG
ncbi:MAG: rhamnan synthesis F family protein [Rhodobacteraceae bacterium]|jgi:hypothetical protein|nr:rhamnan synthesis F family protein [Paracoccaceae bacterium]